jgi:RNA polymerase sigma-70 factor (ECF subfamily)
MLGSAHDADDALQDALLRAWRGLPRFERRSSLRTWLYRIATNACLDLVARRPKRILPLEYGPPAAVHDSPGERLLDLPWLEPYPNGVGETDAGLAAPDARYEQRESLELAFVAALQQLTPRQRAALVLREVLGFSAREIAETLDTTTASVTSALQRARKTLDEQLPPESQQSTLVALGPTRVRRIVDDYMDAMERGDVDAVVALLSTEPTWSMPPMPAWYHGHEAVRAFLVEYALTERWRHVPTRANGQLAVGCYMWDDATRTFAGEVIDVLTLDGDRIAAVTAFVTPSLFARFGLPETLDD